MTEFGSPVWPNNEQSNDLDREPLRTSPVTETLKLEWRIGAPTKPWSEEWFIAETIWGDRVVLRALPEEWTYDFKTTDETYIKHDKIKRWMQFPDSQFIAPDTSGHAQRPEVLVAYCGWHPDHGLNFGTMAETQQGATSRLMMAGVAGNHGWSVIPLYAALSDTSTPREAGS